MPFLLRFFIKQLLLSTVNIIFGLKQCVFIANSIQWSHNLLTIYCLDSPCLQTHWTAMEILLSWSKPKTNSSVLSYSYIFTINSAFFFQDINCFFLSRPETEKKILIFSDIYSFNTDAIMFYYYCDWQLVTLTF